MGRQISVRFLNPSRRSSLPTQHLIASKYPFSIAVLIESGRRDSQPLNIPTRWQNYIFIGKQICVKLLVDYLRKIISKREYAQQSKYYFEQFDHYHIIIKAQIHSGILQIHINKTILHYKLDIAINLLMQPQKIKQTVFFPNPVTVRGQPGFIQATPKYLLYFNGSTVVIRSLLNSQSFFINHNSKVTAAKFSHDFRLIASLDERATLLIHELCPNKLIEIKKFEGCYMGAKRIDWTIDNKRICIVGAGKSKYGRVISIETGTDVGDISGVVAQLTAVSFRPERPFKLCVAGNEHTMKFFDGPPYKFSSSKKTHTNFINEVKYSPDGNLLVSVGSDRKIVLYDGKTGEVLKQLQKAHEGGIMGVDWLTNNTFVTVSSDKFMKFWDAQLSSLSAIPIVQSQIEMKLLDTFIVGVSFCRQTSKLYCLTLGGEIRQFDEAGKYLQSFEGWRSIPLKIISNETHRFIIDRGGKIIEIINDETKRRGKQIECYNIIYIDGCINDKFLFLISPDGVTTVLNLQSNQITSVNTENGNYIRAVDRESDRFIAIAKNCVAFWEKSGGAFTKVQQIKIKQQLSAVYQENNKLFLGSMKGCVIIIEIIENKLKICGEFKNTHNRITCISSNQSHLFIGDSTGAIKVFQQKQGIYTKVSDSMGSHTAGINSIQFIQDKIYTFSMDNSYSIWDKNSFMRKKTISNIHRLGVLSAMKLGDGQIMTSGGDLLVKVNVI